VVKPGLYAMQVRALMEATRKRLEQGGRPIVEIMIPLTVSRPELALARRWVEDVVAEELSLSSKTTHASNGKEGRAKAGRTAKAMALGDVSVGTMIETPRAALLAADIAHEADFFSFGTNDLTQMTFGFSRDDVEGRMMSTYLDLGLLERNPFETIDVEGVGELVGLGIQRGRTTRPGLKVGVCGEHGGDPESIAMFHRAGVDYVSCSPFRVPVARLAAAQAVVRSGGGESPGETGPSKLRPAKPKTKGKGTTSTRAPKA